VDEERFDAIIIGAGLAGSAAAYKMASAGLEVVLIERGDYPGSKNLSGGVLYGRVLHDLIPNYWEEAPVERYINSQVITFLTEQDSFSIDFKTQDFSEPPYNGFSVLRGKFDRWLGEKAEEAGAMLVPGIRVDDLVIEDGRVVGVQAGDEEMRAEVVVAADGANSFMAQKAGLRGPIPTKETAVGVKELIGLPREVIEDRFGLSGDEGKAYAIAGYSSRGVSGGGFLYTNKESISIGVVTMLEDLIKAGLKPADLIEDFLAHPTIAPLVRDGKLLEYGAHLVPEGGLAGMSRLCGDGILVVGDAAGFSVNNALLVRGMDFAIGSGMAAADTIIAAKEAGDFSLSALSGYEGRMKKTFLLQDMQTYAGAPHFLENERLFTKYPEMSVTLMKRLFRLDGRPKKHVLPVMMQTVKEVGISPVHLALDGLKGVRTL
jgi:electron transfer flavoprotein-quinone oxidoreductase